MNRLLLPHLLLALVTWLLPAGPETAIHLPPIVQHGKAATPSAAPVPDRPSPGHHHADAGVCGLCHSCGQMTARTASAVLPPAAIRWPLPNPARAEGFIASPSPPPPRP